MAGRSQPEMLDLRLLRLSSADNVAVARGRIAAGESLEIGGRTVHVASEIPLGHKVAVVPIAAGEKVLKYGAPIGSATAEIRVGAYVHVHNLQSDYLPTYTLDVADDAAVRPDDRQ